MDENPIQPIQPAPILQKPVLKFPIIILVITGLAVASYFALAYSSSLWPFEASQVAIPTFTPRPSVTSPAVSDISDWKTYTSQQYGFEFKYPDIWIAKDDNHDPNELFVALQDPRNNNDLEGSTLYSINVERINVASLDVWFVTQFKDRAQDMPKKQQTTFAGLPALKVDDPISFGGCSSNYIAVINNGFLYKIPDSDCNQDLVTLKINSTFKFIQPNQVDAEGF